MSDPEYDARLARDIAALNAAKGFNLRLFLAENKTLGFAFGGYALVAAALVGLSVAMGGSWHDATIFAVLFAPLVILRAYMRWSRQRVRA